jgi:hypothetical protein
LIPHTVFLTKCLMRLIRWQRPEPGCSQGFARVVVKPLAHD